MLVSAMLLVSLQPLCGRLLLPLLGGAPAVWTTCQLFFQAALLLGYLYAHGLGRLRLQHQVALHLPLALLGLLSLPIALPGSGPPPPGPAGTVPWLLLALSRMALAPCVLLAASAPLLQRWLALSAHRAARDPYFLYVASNLGSLAGVLLYPLVIERHLPLGRQGELVGLGYLVWLGLLGAAAVVVLRRAAPPAPADGPQEAAPPSWQQALRWLAQSLVPASLLLGVTAHLSTDVAATPLLWAIPLALYLGSFMLAFGRMPMRVHRILVRLLPLLVLGLVDLGILRSGSSTPLLAAHLVVFFVAALCCHTELARSRPAVPHLTTYYLILSTGGALGGVVNALVAPLVLDRLLEYPLALIAACMLMPSDGEDRQRGRLALVAPLLVGVVAAAVGGLAVLVGARLEAPGRAGARWLADLVQALPLVLCYALLRTPVRFGMGLGVVTMAGLVARDLAHPVLHRQRSFHGVLTVQADRRTGLRYLLHGTTVHGKQWPDAPRRREPLSYFHRQGPMGEILMSRRFPRVGVVGLGAGTLAAYGEPGQVFTFYEIDAAVVRVARDPRLFTYLADSRATVRIVLGDARLQLGQVPAGSHDLLVLDAFSSDAIPIHLLTREALRLYMATLAPGGLLALHVSNRHFRLQPVVGRLAQAEGLVALSRQDPGDSTQQRDRSEWVVLARSAADLGPLTRRPEWRPPPVGERLWTDDFADPLSALRWR